MCYVGVDRAIKMAQHFGKDDLANEWVDLRDEIRNNIIDKGYDQEKQAFTIAYGKSELDAAILLMTYHQFLDKNDPRIINTVKNIYKELVHSDYLVQRYKMKDDFGKTKSAFTICSFWLIDALIEIGEKEKAEDMFNKLLKRANHVGLFSEDIDIKSKRLIGNFPQAYTHIAIINTSIHLSEWSERRRKIDWSNIHRKKWL